jgi:hypothetical protein
LSACEHDDCAFPQATSRTSAAVGGKVGVKKWLRRIRGALGMGVIWAIGGAAIGGLIELLANIVPGLPWTSIVDMWPQTLAILAFRRGVLFAVILGVARGHRRFEDLSLAQFTAWGALAGVILGGVALAGGAGIVFAGVTTLLSAIGGGSSLVVARMAEDRGLIDAGSDAPDAPLPERKARPLISRSD